MAVIDNDFPFYQLNRSSSLLVTSSYSLDFDVTNLPVAAKELIEKNLKKMKLTNLHGKPTFFAPATAGKQPQQTTMAELPVRKSLTA